MKPSMLVSFRKRFLSVLMSAILTLSFFSYQNVYAEALQTQVEQNRTYLLMKAWLASTKPDQFYSEHRSEILAAAEIPANRLLVSQSLEKIKARTSFFGSSPSPSENTYERLPDQKSKILSRKRNEARFKDLETLLSTPIDLQNAEINNEATQDEPNDIGADYQYIDPGFNQEKWPKIEDQSRKARNAWLILGGIVLGGYLINQSLQDKQIVFKGF